MALEDLVKWTVIEYSDCSLTILGPRIIVAENGKKNYDSVAKFEIEGVGINTIILFFSDRN